MKLERAISKFARNPIYGWDSVSSVWRKTTALGGLQAFDRFITERSFGQKKRILTVAASRPIPTEYGIVRIGETSPVFLVEHLNEDIRYGSEYTLTYLLHEAANHCYGRKASTAVNAAGIPLSSGVTTLFETWIDIDRFTSAGSKRFEETEFTVVTLTLARDLPVDTDCYIETDEGARYNIDEVYDSLDLIQAKGKRIGI